MKPHLIDVNTSGAKTIKVKKVDQLYLDAPFHFHNLCEVVWIEKSFGKRMVGDHIDNFEDGDLVLMGPNLPHIWQNDDIFYRKQNGFEVKSVVIYFPPDFILKLTEEQNVIKPTLDLIDRASRGLRFTGTTNKLVGNILINISKGNGFSRIIHFLQIIEILAKSQEYDYLASISFKNNYDEEDANRISRVYKYLMQNFHHNISLKEIAAICNMTTNSFCRFFKSRTHKSLTQFLNELRIGHACKLLQQPDYSIADVCYECGYNNTANFNKFFKVIMKQTPSEYRRNLDIR